MNDRRLLDPLEYGVVAIRTSEALEGIEIVDQMIDPLGTRCFDTEVYEQPTHKVSAGWAIIDRTEHVSIRRTGKERNDQS